MLAKRRNFYSALWIVIAISVLSGSPELRAYQISGPNLGYVADAVTSTVRAINGIPGASVIGRSVSPDVKIRRAEVSVKGDYALAVTDDAADLLLIGNLSGEASVSPISGAIPGGDALALSPNGSSAVTYSRSYSRLQVIGGLPLNPAVRFEVDTADSRQHLTAVAINDRGQVLAAFSNPGTGTLYLFAAGAAPRLISTVGYVSGIAFAASGERAVIADGARNQVVLLQDLSTTPASIPLADSRDGISNPLGILLSSDAQTAYVVNERSGTVTVVSMGGGAAKQISCQCRPTTMRSLRGDGLFALTERTDEPLVLFDGESADPRILIVPAESQQ